MLPAGANAFIFLPKLLHVYNTINMTTCKECNLTDMLLPKPDVRQERELAGHSDNYPKL